MTTSTGEFPLNMDTAVKVLHSPDKLSHVVQCKHMALMCFLRKIVTTSKVFLWAVTLFIVTNTIVLLVVQSHEIFAVTLSIISFLLSHK